MKTTTRTLLGTALLALLGACGGGDGEATPQPPTETVNAVPAQASASAAGLIRYLRDLVAASSETTEPADLSAFAPKAGDDAEPDAL